MHGDVLRRICSNQHYLLLDRIWLALVCIGIAHVSAGWNAQRSVVRLAFADQNSGQDSAPRPAELILVKKKKAQKEMGGTWDRLVQVLEHENQVQMWYNTH